MRISSSDGPDLRENRHWLCLRIFISKRVVKKLMLIFRHYNINISWAYHAISSRILHNLGIDPNTSLRWSYRTKSSACHSCSNLTTSSSRQSPSPWPHRPPPPWLHGNAGSAKSGNPEAPNFEAVLRLDDISQLWYSVDAEKITQHFFQWRRLYVALRFLSPAKPAWSKQIRNTYMNPPKLGCSPIITVHYIVSKL